jgi:hypothetical protein
MSRFVISLVAAGAALAVASPAAAQYYPAPPPGHGAPYGNAYGYNNYGNVRALQVRINQIQRQVENLYSRRMISRDEVNGLRSESRDIERRLRDRSRNGLNINEIRNVEMRIARLEQHVQHEVRDGRGWNNRGYGFVDRDHDGRNDRYEDDRGTRHDR